MTNDEIIKWLESLKAEIGKAEHRTLWHYAEAIDMAIEALSEPINCVKCKHYYETEDDTDVHGHCRMDTAHTNLIGKEEAIERLKQNKAAAEFYAGMVQNTNAIENELKDIEAIDMAIEALSIDVVSREEYEEVKVYMDTLVDAFIEDGKELAKSIKVVRCNDCKWYQGVHSVQGHAPCEWFNKQVLWNDFCSNGEPYKGGDAK